MTPEQREAAIRLMADRLAQQPYAGAHQESAACLDALLSEFVVLHRDDVAEERGDSPATNHLRRLVTRWEPITNTEDTDA